MKLFERCGVMRGETRGLPDDTCNGMKPFALAVCTFHGLDFFEVNVIRHPALQAVRE
jgi:hypothetical protein